LREGPHPRRHEPFRTAIVPKGELALGIAHNNHGLFSEHYLKSRLSELSDDATAPII